MPKVLRISECLTGADFENTILNILVKSAEREPATKYLDLQLMLFWWMEKNKDLSIREQVEMIYDYLSEQYYSKFTWEKLIKRPLMLDTKNWIPQRV